MRKQRPISPRKHVQKHRRIPIRFDTDDDEDDWRIELGGDYSQEGK